MCARTHTHTHTHTHIYQGKMEEKKFPVPVPWHMGLENEGMRQQSSGTTMAQGLRKW